MRKRKKVKKRNKTTRGIKRKRKRNGRCFLSLRKHNTSYFFLFTEMQDVPRESEEFMLDEDDYMLLQDNNITGISRPKLVSFLSETLLFPVQVYLFWLCF